MDEIIVPYMATLAWLVPKCKNPGRPLSEIVNVTFPVVSVRSLPTPSCWVPHL